VKIKVIAIVVVALMASLYSYLNYQKQIAQIIVLQPSAADQDETTDSPQPAPTPPAQKTAQHLSLEQQLQQQFQQATSSGRDNPLDEDLVTEISGTGNRTPYPSDFNRPLDQRGELLADMNDSLDIARHWDANSGEMKTVLALTDIRLHAAVPIKNGYLFRVEDYKTKEKHSRYNMVFINTQGVATSVKLKAQRSEPRMLLLSDQSVLLVGGRELSANNTRVNAVELIRLNNNGSLSVEQLPDMPGPPRWGYTPVALANGGAMVLGGNTSEYVGCKAPDCKNETYVLDMNTKTWSDGPKLIEPRAEASASLLPDGSVLVAGGWGADSVGNARRSRSSERLMPGTKQFEASATLAVPVANQSAIVVNANSKAPLVLIDRNSGSVQAYDLARNEWRMVGEFVPSSEPSPATILGPFIDNQNVYLWAGSYLEKEWQRVSLSLPSFDTLGSVSQLDPKSGLVLHRAGIGFLAPDVSRNGLVVGGSVSPDWVPTAVVDSVSIDGRVQSLAPLNHARSGAQIFRLPDGSIVVAGGVGEILQLGRPDTRPVPLEWLVKPDTQSRWQSLNVDHPSGTYYTQLANGDLVAVLPNGNIEQLSFHVNAQQMPNVTSTTFAPSTQLRRSDQSGEPLIVRGLADGRLIVAGGYVQTRRIAVLRNDPDVTNTNDTDNRSSDDEFVGTGGLERAKTYDIYDPQTHVWQTSAAAQSAGGATAILSDGRVVKISVPATPDKNKAAEGSGDALINKTVEISSADGTAWSELRAEEPPQVDLNSADLFVIDDEVFLSGIAAQNSGKTPARIVQWFDMATRRWSTVWQAPARVIGGQARVIRVTLGNNKTLSMAVKEN
jgi:hypothetical protein